ncbi:MAG: cache domain-containing protein [Gemmatimonadetes bacterium]|nr:cache domain-containing protein [Gemmatimonadota bacterium]
MTGLIGLFSGAKPVLAQDAPITADQVTDRETLETFVEGAKAHIEGIFAEGDPLAPFLDSTRMEGDWKHENVFLMLLSLDGTVLFHGDDDEAVGKNLFNLQDDRGEAVVRALIEAGLMDGGHVEYHWDDPGDDEDDPVKMAYATSFFGSVYNNRVVLVGGFYQDLSHVELPMVDASLIAEPEVTAADVMDRASLQAFVIGAVRGYVDALREHGTHRYSDILDVFRIEDGHWRHGAIYLFILNDDGYVIFHGADRTQEARNQSHLEDINGVKFVQEFIKVAKESGSGFVEYQYDDPSVPGDEETGTPKLSYIHSFETRATGRRVIFGAGIYFDVSDVADSITLAAEPSSISEGGGPQTVTITATNTGDPLPVSARLPLTLSGTASGDDYTVTGDMHILIPAESTVGTTELVFVVANDGVDEPGGETIVVKASYEGLEVGTATISVLDVLVPPLPVGDVTAEEVMDRVSLRSFVQAAKAAYKGAIDELGFDHHGDVVEAFRVEDGNWRLGEIYLFFLQSDGLLVFHGANPSFEELNIFDDQDLNGVYYTRELIAAAQAGGGFVEYYFDNPAVDGDEETGSPKVSYSETVMVDGMELVIGSGFYFDLTGYVPEITLSVTPEAVSEDGGTQTVRVTATQTSGAIPITTVIPLALSGTAGSDDYSVRGDLSITIPGEAAAGSSELSITVISDDVYESGGETIIVTARYDGQDLDSATVTITDSYDAPAIVGSPPSVSLEAGESGTIDAGALFSGTDPSLSASTSDNSVATAVMSAATLTVTGVRKGSATVTVTARNAAGEASLTVGVTVTAIAAERMVYENILSAMGRNMLSSVSSTIGGRFSDGTGGRGFTVGGRRIDGFASSVAALARLTGHGRQVSAKRLALLNDGENRRYVNSGYLLSTSSFSYAPEDGTANGGLRWSVWGAGDLQNFQGEPDVNTSYDGDMKTAYVGFDVATERNWLAGIALSHATGQSDYDVTVASGSLESRLTSVLPYLRWKCSTGLTEVWSIVGLGTGEVDVEDAASDLTMRMAMVGTRMRVAGTGGTGLDVIGDAGLLRLSTADSESPSLSDIESDVQRVRIGLEGSRTSTLAGGTTITPYAQVAGRYDGGTGQTGQGLEVSGGLRLSGGRVGVNAQGRFLAVHTADGYSENGFSVAAYLNPGAGGTGLSMSVAPRIGAGTRDSGMMWRDRPLAGTSVNGRDNTRAFKAEVGYGLAYPSIGMLMTPFGEMYLLGDDRRQMRLGARLAQSGSLTGGASLELSGMRLDRHGSASDHRIGLLARMSF